jgi:hypothetical protein
VAVSVRARTERADLFGIEPETQQAVEPQLRLIHEACV